MTPRYPNIVTCVECWNTGGINHAHLTYVFQDGSDDIGESGYRCPACFAKLQQRQADRLARRRARDTRAGTTK